MRRERPREPTIYCIRCMLTERVYVGSTVSFQARQHEHLYKLRRGRHHSAPLQNAWNKHGEAAFFFEVLEVVSDVAGLVTSEQAWIDRLQAADRAKGFNVCPVAGSPRGFRHSPETLAKRSAAFKGKKRPPRSAEWSAKISAGNRGRKRAPFSESHKQAISAALKRYKAGVAKAPPQLRLWP